MFIVSGSRISNAGSAALRPPMNPQMSPRMSLRMSSRESPQMSPRMSRNEHLMIILSHIAYYRIRIKFSSTTIGSRSAEEITSDPHSPDTTYEPDKWIRVPYLLCLL